MGPHLAAILLRRHFIRTQAVAATDINTGARRSGVTELITRTAQIFPRIRNLIRTRGVGMCEFYRTDLEMLNIQVNVKCIVTIEILCL